MFHGYIGKYLDRQCSFCIRMTSDISTQLIHGTIDEVVQEPHAPARQKKSEQRLQKSDFSPVFSQEISRLWGYGVWNSPKTSLLAYVPGPVYY